MTSVSWSRTDSSLPLGKLSKYFRIRGWPCLLTISRNFIIVAFDALSFPPIYITYRHVRMTAAFQEHIKTNASFNLVRVQNNFIDAALFCRCPENTLEM